MAKGWGERVAYPQRNQRTVTHAYRRILRTRGPKSPTQTAAPSDTFAELGEVLGEGAMEGVKARRAHVPSFGGESRHMRTEPPRQSRGSDCFATALPVAGEALVNPILGGHPMRAPKQVRRGRA